MKRKAPIDAENKTSDGKDTIKIQKTASSDVKAENDKRNHKEIQGSIDLDPEEKNDDENEESHATLSLLCGYGSDDE